MDLQRFFKFDEFVTPTLITIVYILGVLVITLASLYMLTTIYSAGSSSWYSKSEPSWHFENAIIAVAWFIFGNLYWRVFCEIVIVIFKINNHLTSIDGYFLAINKNP